MLQRDQVRNDETRKDSIACDFLTPKYASCLHALNAFVPFEVFVFPGSLTCDRYSLELTAGRLVRARFVFADA